MSEERVAIALYGLDVRQGHVRADVFARKIGTLVQALRLTDKLINGGKPTADYLISDLKTGSAHAELREVQASTKRRSRHSSIVALGRIAARINDGETTDVGFDAAIVRRIELVAKGAGKAFSHGEIAFPGNVVRIDEFLIDRCERAVRQQRRLANAVEPRFFEGTTMGRIDGVLKEVDLRGTIKRAKLIATAGDVEIDCVCNEVSVPALGENLDRRVRIEGKFIYESTSAIPRRIDIRDIKPVTTQDADLTRWRGALAVHRDDDETGW